MADDDRYGGKRSRFDQTEPDSRRSSRFDRRSRSPSARRVEARDRSPIARDGAPSEARSPPVDPAAAAAAAAARINAQLQARKGIQHVDVPPIQKPDQDQSPTTPSRPALSNSSGPPRQIDGEMYVSDGDYIKDIEVNDLRNRYVLTKSSTQKMIKEQTGADVTTRGSYYPNKNMATAANPPLHLHVTSTTKEGLEAAVAKIQEYIQQELPQLVDERRFRRRDQEQPHVERDEYGRRKWPEEKVFVGLEPVPGFNLRAQIVGSGGSYVKHIQSETGCRVQIKGRGSGYLEIATNRECDEDMFLHVTGPDPKMVEKGKELCEDLVANVRDQYEEFKTRPPRHGDRGGYGDHHRGGRPHDQSYSYGRSASDHQVSTSANAGDGAANNAASAADWSQYAAQYYANGQDPYAAYGGYQNYMAWYQYYYGQGATGQVAPGQVAPGQVAPGQSAAPPPPSEAAPPPPPSDAPPPPPSSSSPPAPPASSTNFHAVPPPPGL
ncbi:hypothetical protein GQ602_006667 [Ophiocordyceps camponoti-floridani]|uniref:K Homology domain-containing protein n=1 Tax=Ophiocordyceps camponoti-floridani TaxID=2030778 RepID=A0A8H4VAY2_9HYPO|nr:hypothetical protein GQ602_006667 [Ophiocordyceps camponoti-floridani]